MRFSLVAVVVLLPFLPGAGAVETKSRSVMSERHKTLLEQNCQNCHGAEKQKGKFRVDDLSFDITNIETAERWQKVLNQMNSGEMPPEEEKQPTAAAKTDFLDELANVMVSARKSLADQKGAITMRRLNRREYKNTLRELLGVEINVSALPSDRLLMAGVAYIPQHRSVFPRLTIEENLQMGGYLVRDKALLAQRIDRVLNLFPILKTRAGQLAGMMSGGEQRMLEIARTLLQEPQLIMLDEPSIGLSPKMVDAVFDNVRLLREQGKAILMVEQNVRKALSISDRGGVMELGSLRMQDQAARLIGDERVARLYLGRR